MYFIIASLLVAVSCSAITIRTLVGYNNLGLGSKLLISFLVIAGWTAPLLIGWIRKNDYLAGSFFSVVSYAAYFLFGLAFILFVMLFLRDFVWYLFYGAAKLFKSASWWINPKNITVLGYANVVVVLLALAASVYAAYEAVRIPDIKTVEFSTPKLKDNLSIVQLSDLHLNRTSSLRHLKNIVEKTNALQPDIILLTGDVVDDKIDRLDEYMEVLQGLKARYGIYFSIGNHEYYNGLYRIIKKLNAMGIRILFNRGVSIPELNVFVSGIPDAQTAAASSFFSVNFEKAVKGSLPEQYRILMSHNPEMAEYVTPVAFDLQVSGHTHGGQIFPFHFLASKANKYLAGSYKVNDVDLYVSRGAGYWGPPMRLLAPAEITHIVVKAALPVKVKKEKKVDEHLQEMINAQNFGLGL